MPKSLQKKATDDERMARIARTAFILRQQGMSLYDIAERLAVTEDVVKTGITMSLRRAAELVTDGTRTDIMNMELARLDRLQASVWPAAMDGDTRAVDSVLKIMDRRAKFLGLDDSTRQQINQAVIVAGDTRTYVDALRSLTRAPLLEDDDG